MIAPLADKSHLVIVAGHAICRDLSRPTADESWILLDFQRGEPPCYLEHIRRGVELAAVPESLLVFSGGQSRRDAGPRSEAQSYYWLADHHGWWGQPGIAARAFTEEFARDSFENLLFSICRFREVTGHNPAHVTFVSWEFKRRRFDLHRAAIHWPASRFTYVGANDPPHREQALRAEAETERLYQADPYSGYEPLVSKRDSRNPFRRQHGYGVSCPDLQVLFSHRGPGPAPLPSWSVEGR